MTSSELYYFIGKCLAMDNDPEARQQVFTDITAGNVAWEEFVWMGSSHLVLPALYAVFKRNGVLPLLPADLEEHLQSIYKLNVDRNTQIKEQSIKLIRILNEKGIKPIFLKGAGHLLKGLYRDDGERIMSDIDLLIPEDVIEKAAQVLYDNGYSHPEEFADDDFEKHHHLPGFEHNNFIALVEIHNYVFPGSYSKILSNAEIESEKKKLKGLNAWVLSYQHQMIHNFVHDQLVDDGFKYKTMVIKGLYDFFLLTIQEPSESIRLFKSEYASKFNSYCFMVSALFKSTDAIGFKNNLPATRFKKQFDYLLNHPKMQSGYQLIILYRLRISEVFRLFVTAPFSRSSRKYILKKAGNASKVKQYTQKLMRGE